MDKIAKALSIFVVVMFVILSSAIGFFQTDYAKKKLKQTLASQDVFTYEKIEGVLPFEITLKNVTIKLDGKAFFIETLKARPSLVSMLKKQIHFHYLKDNEHR